MPTIEAAMKRHSVLVYFALAFVISWDGALLILGPGGRSPTRGGIRKPGSVVLPCDLSRPLLGRHSANGHRRWAPRTRVRNSASGLLSRWSFEHDFHVNRRAEGLWYFKNEGMRPNVRCTRRPLLQPWATAGERVSQLKRPPNGRCIDERRADRDKVNA